MSTVTNNDTDEKPDTKRRRRTRRNYSAELLDLQSRVDLALRLLRKEQTTPLLAVAIETLEGK